MALLLVGSTASASCADFADVIDQGAYGVADIGGTVRQGCNLDTPFIPASLLKISTALAALEVLGPNYRFRTEFFLDRSGNLFIRGFGDPLLVSEEVALIAAVLRERGLDQVDAVFIDDQAYHLEGPVPGSEHSTNPYDAPVAPTSVNFNSVPFNIGTDGTMSSGESQTPMLPLMREFAAGRSPGRYRINICYDGADAATRAARYAAELFSEILRQQGSSVIGRVGRGRVPPGAKRVHVHESTRSLEETCSIMLRYSSNFIANQLYLTIGAETFGYPATWDKAKRAVAAVLRRHLGKEVAAGIIQQEGAGLSRENRLDARTMLALLGAFKPFARLLHPRENVLLKTGTMENIYNFAGYLEDGSPFVILLNQEANTRTAVLRRLRQAAGRTDTSVRETTALSAEKAGMQ